MVRVPTVARSFSFERAAELSCAIQIHRGTGPASSQDTTRYQKVKPLMKNFEWLCGALQQLDQFAEERNLNRFREALSAAADAAIEDLDFITISNSSAQSNVIALSSHPRHGREG
jgi:hypothetical protein